MLKDFKPFSVILNNNSMKVDTKTVCDPTANTHIDTAENICNKKSYKKIYFFGDFHYFLGRLQQTDLTVSKVRGANIGDLVWCLWGPLDK